MFKLGGLPIGGQVARAVRRASQHCISIRFMVALVLAITVSYACAQTQKNVLVLHGGFPKLPYNIAADQEIEDVFASDRDFHIQTFNEYRDEKRLYADDSQFIRFLSEKYKGQNFDLIVTVSPIALHLLVNEKPNPWANTPVVFTTIDRGMIPKDLPARFTGVASKLDVAGTLDLALRLQPDVDQVFYVVGISEWEQFVRRTSEADLQRFAGRVTIKYLDQIELPELLTRVSQLPPRSIVLYQEFNKDPSGRVYVPPQVCSQLSVSANVPVYAISYVGNGTVGGSVVTFNAADRKAALMALRVLHGEKPLAQVVDAPPSSIRVDWRQLQRWKLSESRLPAGAIVEFREPTLWQRYWGYILTSVAVFALQFLLIVKLKIEGRRRQRSESELKRLSGRLINAGEQERKRIARELHDDIGQRLAMISLELDSQKDEANEQDWVNQTLREVHELSTDVHDLSHQLHSSRLEALGLEGALRTLCQQLARQHQIDIRYSGENVPFPLAEDTALCFYRVAQEALNNSIKYSGSERADLRIFTDDGSLRMTIRDYGCGFSTAGAASGLGLATMRERLRLEEGRLLINSKPGKGTEVTAEVRLNRQPGNHAA